MSILTHNVMTALKRMALPEQYSTFSIRPAGSSIMRVAWCVASVLKVGDSG
jgi:hypothetical protein